MKAIHQAGTRLKREVNYRMSKWIITNVEQLLSPEEIEEIWRGLLSFYLPPTASVENVCGTMTGNGLGKYVVPSKIFVFLVFVGHIRAFLRLLNLGRAGDY